MFDEAWQGRESGEVTVLGRCLCRLATEQLITVFQSDETITAFLTHITVCMCSSFSSTYHCMSSMIRYSAPHVFSKHVTNNNYRKKFVSLVTKSYSQTLSQVKNKAVY